MTLVDLLGDYRGSDSFRGTGELAQTRVVVTGLLRRVTRSEKWCESWARWHGVTRRGHHLSTQWCLPERGNQNIASTRTLDRRAAIIGVKLTEWNQTIVFTPNRGWIRQSDLNIQLTDEKYHCNRWKVKPFVSGSDLQLYFLIKQTKRNPMCSDLFCFLIKLWYFFWTMQLSRDYCKYCGRGL